MTMPRAIPISPQPATLAQTHRALLGAGRWFAGLPITLQDELLARARVLPLEHGQVLFRRGDAPCGLYAVLRGAIRISGAGGGAEDGREAMLTLLEPPNWFGEISLVDGQPRTHDAVAEGTCSVLQVPQAALAALLAREPAHWRQIAMLMTHKLRLAFGALEDAALAPAPQRLARRLLLMAEGYGQMREGVPAARRALSVSQEQLSMMLSVSRQTVNQILKDLQAQGVLRLGRSQVEIIDATRLRQAALGLGGPAARGPTSPPG